jgi:hypothetical protein
MRAKAATLLVQKSRNDINFVARGTLHCRVVTVLVFNAIRSHSYPQ